VFTPKKDIADWLETYAQVMKLDVWTSTQLQSATWGGFKWQISLLRKREGGRSEKISLQAQHIIQATGEAGKPNVPIIPGISSFEGFNCHSATFSGAPRCTDGKAAVIVGSGNSAHDIAQDYYDKGWKVTIVQRSSTTVDLTQYNSSKGLYREDGLPTRDADLLTHSIPTSLLKRTQIEATAQMRQENSMCFEKLQKMGFCLNWGPDSSG
jgi:cation diffusion facilitator CzcD-associated flavoprotein CzcO